MKSNSKIIALTLIILILFSVLPVKTFAAAAQIVSIKDISATVYVKNSYTLPRTVTAAMSDKSAQQVAVAWSPQTADTSKIGTYKYSGTVKGYLKKVILTLKVIPIPVYKDPELARAVSLGIGVYSESTIVTYKQFFKMLDAVVARANPGAVSEWKAKFPKARLSDKTMRRDEGMLATFLAAETLGKDYITASSDWYKLNEKIGDSAWDHFTWDYQLLPGWEQPTQFDINKWDNKMIAAYFYAMGRISLYSDKLIFDYDSSKNTMRQSDPFTYQEALLAALRLHDSGPNITDRIPEPGDEKNAVFTNKFLEKRVRKQLNKAEKDVITVGELKKITDIKFAAGYDVSGKDSYYGYEVFGGDNGVSTSKFNGTSYDFYFYDLKDLAQFHKLKTLVIIGDQVTDLSPLQGLPLEELDLSRNHITDITPLSKIKTLTKLNLSGNPVSNITPLAQLNNLSILNLYDTNITDISSIKSLNLWELNLGYDLIKDLTIINKMNLHVLTTIGSSCEDYSFLAENKTLDIWRTSIISDKIAGYLAKSNISDLFIEYNTSKEPLTDLNLKNLKSISLTSLKFANLDFLKNCSAITTIRMWRNTITDISALENLKNLQQIEIVASKINDISVLSSLKQLKNVTLPYTFTDSYNKIKSSVTWTPTFSNESYYESPMAQRFILSGTPEPKPSELAFAEAKYVPIGNAGTYDKSIITEKMLAAASSLPEASNQHLPYWNGVYTITNSYSGNLFGTTRWRKEEIKFLADQGMNYVRILYDFSYLSNPKNINEVDLSELRRFDELISWCVQYGVHIELAMLALPGMYGASIDACDIGKSGGKLYFTSAEEQKIVKNYWTMLAARYAGISNKYLSFDLYAEPNSNDAPYGTFAKVAADLAKAIWQTEGNKPDSQKRITIVEVNNANEAEDIAKAGCPISLHNSGVHRFAVGSSLVYFYENYPYLPDNTSWPLYLQNVIWQRDTGNNVLTIQTGTDTNFPSGTIISVYMMNDTPATMGIYADGSNIFNKSALEKWTREKDNTYSVKLSSSANKIEIKNEAYYTLTFYLIKITKPGQEPIYITPHTFANTFTVNESCAVLTIDKNGTVTSNKTVDAEWYYRTQLRPFVELGKKYNVGFMVGEFQVDMSVPVPIAYSYEEMLIKSLHDNNIGWCNSRSLLLSVRNGGVPVNYPGTPWYYDDKMWEVIRKYQK